MSRAFPFSPLAMAGEGLPERAVVVGALAPLADGGVLVAAGGGVSSATGGWVAVGVLGGGSKSDGWRLREAFTRAACDGCG